jgi:prepilin-type N-terminal cleavage/methylation domain-containing protein
MSSPVDDEGFTLIECLISIAILGIAFAALLGGMAASSTTSDFHRKEATANTLLVSATESVKDVVRNPFHDCGSGLAYNPYTGVVLPTPSWRITIDSVLYWDGTTFQGTCSPDYRLQLINLRVTSPDSRAIERVGIVKQGP